MKNQIFKILFVAGLVFGIDQLSKIWAAQAGLIHLNGGISFSIGVAVPQYLYLIFGLMLLGSIWQLLQKYWLEHGVTAGLFFGAAVSNLVDRLMYGGVRDWLIIPGTSISNNLADWVLSFAVLLVAFETIMKAKNEN